VTAYLARRAMHAVFVLFIVALAAFLLIHLVPGDPVRITLGAHAPADAVRRVRHQLGLDRSLAAQFGSFLTFFWMFASTNQIGRNHIAAVCW